MQRPSQVAGGATASLLRTAVTCALLLCAALRADHAGAQIDVSIPVQRDTTIMEAHPRDNDGAWGFLWLKWNSARGFENRVALGFDLAPLAGRAGDVRAASIVLRAADHTFPIRGTRLGIFFMDPEAPLQWAEGSRRYDKFSYCGRRDLFRPPTAEGTPGATWICEDDRHAVGASGGASCEPSPLAAPWRGGFPAAGEPAEQPPRGFRTSASVSQVEHKLYDPLCRRALACFAASASSECWRKVELDVTDDVREALSLGRLEPSWLLKKDVVEAGAARFFSREGAVCILGIPDLRPQLHVTLDERPGDPPVIPEPPADCG